MTKTVHVYPSTNLNADGGEYLPGIGIDGADLPEAEANDLLKRGLARRTRPAEDDIKPEPPAAPAEPEE